MHAAARIAGPRNHPVRMRFPGADKKKAAALSCNGFSIDWRSGRDGPHYAAFQRGAAKKPLQCYTVCFTVVEMRPV